MGQAATLNGLLERACAEEDASLQHYKAQRVSPL